MACELVVVALVGFVNLCRGADLISLFHDLGNFFFGCVFHNHKKVRRFSAWLP